MALNGNQGTLPIGDHAVKVLSQRFAGMFLTESDLLALPVEARTHGTVALVLETGALLYFDQNDDSSGLAPEAGSGAWKDARTAMTLFGRSASFAAADLADADGFVESLATSTDPVTLTGADLDGALVVEDPAETFTGLAPKSWVSFWPTVTSDASAGAFEPLVDIEFIGTYAGAAVTRVAQLTEADGDETIFADGPMDTLTSIEIPAMADTDGALTFGFSGVSPQLDSSGNFVTWYVVSDADVDEADTAAVHVGYTGGVEDTVKLAKGQELKAKPIRIYADTTAALKIYR